ELRVAAIGRALRLGSGRHRAPRVPEIRRRRRRRRCTCTARRMTDRQDIDPKASAHPAKGPFIGFAAALAVYFGLSVVYFLPAFLPGQHIYGSDYLAGGYFFHEFISSRFAGGTLPKWVPHVYGGLPL